MTQPAGEIVDLIVREVMARLEGVRSAPAPVHSDPTPVRSDPIHRVPDPPNPPGPHDSGHDERREGDLVVGARVVALTAVEERLEGVRRLVVCPGAVVTPSVRDELRRRNVALVRDRSAAELVVPPGTIRRMVGGRSTSEDRLKAELQTSNGGLPVLIMVLGSRFDAGPVEKALAAEELEVRVERTDCLVAATDAVARELDGPGGVAMVVSTYPAVAACLANRHAGVRAVVGIDPGRLAGDAASVGANVLVLDPRLSGPFPLRQMAVQFCRRAPFACPEELRERLQ